MEKGKELIEVAKETNIIREWFSNAEDDRANVLEQRSSILQ